MARSPVPGPSFLAAAKATALLLRDPLRVYSGLRREFGDVVRVPFAPGHPFYLLSRPEHAEHVLVAQQDRYAKAFTYRPLKAFLGDGLLTSEGETWRRHRGLIQPVFQRRHIDAFDGEIVAAARRRAAGWRPGAVVDVATEMRTLTMDVVGRVLFGTDLAERAAAVGASVSRLQRSIVVASFLAPFGSPERLRRLTLRVPGVAKQVATVEDVVDQIVGQRTSSPPAGEPRDLLDRLIAATAPGDGATERLTEQELHDEVMTLVLAGHETTANTLTWALLLLSRFPAARERLEVEVEEVLTGRDASAADMDKLVWTQAVISEAMRLYPPAWTIERDAAVDDDLDGVPIPAGATVAVSPYLIHRHPEFWPNPEGFAPERFLPDAPSRPKYAFVPFGGGRRICVGAGFAQLEATLALATIAGSHRLDLHAGTQVRVGADVTIHPRGPLPMVVTPRD